MMDPSIVHDDPARGRRALLGDRSRVGEQQVVLDGVGDGLYLRPTVGFDDEHEGGYLRLPTDAHPVDVALPIPSQPTGHCDQCRE